MKKIVALILTFLLVCSALTLMSCGNGGDKETSATEPVGTEVPKAPETVRSFVAEYAKTVAMGPNSVEMNGRVLINLTDDGTADLYVGLLAMDSLEQAHYTGTWSIRENDEHDDVLTVNYTTDGGAANVIDSAVIIDSEFSSVFYMIGNMTTEALTFYEIAPVTVGTGDGYVGFLSRLTGMGTMIYAYYAELVADGTFSVSIMQRATGMFVQGTETGTYTKESDGTVTFTYNVLDSDDLTVVVKENHVSVGTVKSDVCFSVGFNIGQAVMAASPADFLCIKPASAE